MEAKTIGELKIGQEQYIDVLVQSVTKATSRNGSPYEKMVVRDHEGNMTTVLNWGAPFSENPPAVVHLRVMTEQYQECPAYRMVSFEASNEKREKFLPKRRINMRESWAELVGLLQGIRPELYTIAKNVLEADQKAFLLLPLTQSEAFSCTCGILEATLKLTKLAEHSAQVLGLDRDLCIAAAALYYSGSTQCVDSGFMATPDETLFGAGISSYTKVVEWLDTNHADEKESIRESQDFKLLCHILLSRYKGVQTAVPEALLLRHLDAIVQETDEIKDKLALASPGSVTSIKGIGKFYQRV